jgi:uncharacterized protein (DUF433 family)
MDLPLDPEPCPIHVLENGAARLIGTRRALEGVVQCWNAGQSPESLAQDFSLDLQQVYATIAYYLRHRDLIDAYVREGEEEFERLRAEFEREFPPKVTAEELKRRWAELHAPIPG